MTTFTCFVPATSANLGPGFDCMGLALPFGNRFDVRVLDAPGSDRSYRMTGAEAPERLEVGDNLFWTAAEVLAARVGRPLPALEVVAEVAIPLSRGLGSSASATVGGLLAANRSLGDPIDLAGLVALATEIEGHPDNVVPALVGGVSVSLVSDSRVVFERLELPRRPGLVVAVPDFKLSTAVARAALPPVVPLQDAVYNVGRAALLTAALVSGRLERLIDALGDRLHEPYRRKLVPGMPEVVSEAVAAGAWGVTLSGAGPTLLAWCPPERCSEVAARVTEAWQGAGIACRAIATEIASLGATINEGCPWP